VVQTGHAIEFRIISEDPHAGFMPSLGGIDYLRLPSGDGVRVDAGYAQGDTVTPHYDSLLAKVIVHGADRLAAFERARTALQDFHCIGVQTCVPFHLAALDDEGFRSGDFHIHHAERRMGAGLVKWPDSSEAAALAAVMAWRHEQHMRAAWRRGDSGMSAWTRSALKGMR
jgi:acetyl/propionyl-CoA carboxylase alpha subunit